jgi:uncharacterized membrane protein YciS (DUF1049 family)
MRVLLKFLMAVVFTAAGILFGAFNAQTVHIDFHLFQITASLGVSLLVALFIGAALGGIAVTVGIVWPLQRRLRKLARESATTQLTQNAPASSA